MSDRFRKNHSVDGWPIEDTYTGLFFQSFNKDDLVVALNSYEDLAASQQERIEELEKALRYSIYVIEKFPARLPSEIEDAKELLEKGDSK